MSFLEYRWSDGFVRAVHSEQPSTVEKDFEIVEYDELKAGDEYEYVIHIDPEEIDEDGAVRSHYAVRQGPPQEEVMRRIKKLEDEIAELKAETQ